MVVRELCLLFVAHFNFLSLILVLKVRLDTKSCWGWWDGLDAGSSIAIVLELLGLRQRASAIGLGHEDRGVCGPFRRFQRREVLILLGLGTNGGVDEDFKVVWRETTRDQGGTKGTVLLRGSKLLHVSDSLEVTRRRSYQFDMLGLGNGNEVDIVALLKLFSQVDGRWGQ